jgi:hypothetical protein
LRGRFVRRRVTYLVPWFAPTLRRVRTVPAGVTSKAGPTFEDFNRLFRFTHLEERYRNCAWVVTDGDVQGKELIEDLRARYCPPWYEDRFRRWSSENFEEYYPARFDEPVSAALALSGRAKRDAKRELLHEVLAWCEQEPELARGEFEASAEEVAAFLREVEAVLFG